MFVNPHSIMEKKCGMDVPSSLFLSKNFAVSSRTDSKLMIATLQAVFERSA